MVHMREMYAHDFWLRSSSDQMVELTCLMPTGILIPIEVNSYDTLHEIKEDLFEEATKYPMHWTLHDSDSYIFSCVNSMAVNEELLDEGRRLCDVKPFLAILKLIERKQGDKATSVLNVKISTLIGKAINEFEHLKNPEVNYYRWKMKSLTDEVLRGNQGKDWLQKLMCQFPPRLDYSDTLLLSCTSKLREGNLIVSVKFENYSFMINTPHNSTPKQLMVAVLHKKSYTYKSREDRLNEYVFKVKGQEEFIVGEAPIMKFKYIQESLSRDIPPCLVVVHVDSIPMYDQSDYESVDILDEKKMRSSFSTLTLRKKGKLISSWNINDSFTFQVSAICKLNLDFSRNTDIEICVHAGLFHGGKALCEPQRTTVRNVNKENCTCAWDEDLQFDIKISNIPRMARLCFAVCEISKTKGPRSRKLKDAKQEIYVEPLCWVNTTIYDFKGQLRNGAMTLYMWTYTDDTQSEDLLHSLGTVSSNTSVDHATCLTITFHKFHAENTVVYPTMEKILEFSKENDASAPRLQTQRLSLENLNALLNKTLVDPCYEMYDQERKLLWAHRYELMRQRPELIPKLLDCVEWNDHHEVSEAMALLSKWPLLPPEKAMELLDFAYADQTVRSYAVRCLAQLSDDELSLFLLQLVQALKHECYLHCDLGEFLLRRAFNNKKLGHYLFWHLKSEMNVPSVWVRFGLMLETYCRGNPNHINCLTKQVDLVSKLKICSESVRLRRDKDKAKAFLQENLSMKHMTDAFENVINPLDPSYRSKSVKIEKCRVMDSKMRPLWLVMENDDAFGDDIYMIFKNGDDLRQDMLTLQMIKIMDRIWKDEGLDLRMNPYNCISTDNRVGLIEVVLNAETIANIQKEKGMFSATSAFRKGSLLAWLKDHNPNESALNKAIEEFTYSCAGYCVATYVLGVADRHSDNIMVKQTGQLFHIDFGHILGHFKEKFGFKRERVPFVLTHDFVHVINKGQTKKEALEFQKFQKHCEQAFLILRKHGGLILSLFAMMISTGLPELCCVSDLNYLRETLVLDKTEADALTHFRSKFDEALGNSWKTSLNWASHNMVKSNK